MNHTQTFGRATRRTRLVKRTLLVALTLTSLLAADQAMARKAKGGLSSGIRPTPAAQAVAHAAPQAALDPQVIKPIPHPRRHGSKGSTLSR
ncbi:MAG TPA: hypothetical protein VKP68_18540 [Ramlibacter sp.]|nr:hypothetical protein [Ramlibacter sp.]